MYAPYGRCKREFFISCIARRSVHQQHGQHRRQVLPDALRDGHLAGRVDVLRLRAHLRLAERLAAIRHRLPLPPAAERRLLLRRLPHPAADTLRRVRLQPRLQRQLAADLGPAVPGDRARLHRSDVVHALHLPRRLAASPQRVRRGDGAREADARHLAHEGARPERTRHVRQLGHGRRHVQLRRRAALPHRREGAGGQHHLAGDLHDGDLRLVDIRHLRLREAAALHVHALLHRDLLDRRHARQEVGIPDGDERHLHHPADGHHNPADRHQVYPRFLPTPQVPALRTRAEVPGPAHQPGDAPPCRDESLKLSWHAHYYC